MSVPLRFGPCSLSPFTFGKEAAETVAFAGIAWICSGAVRLAFAVADATA